MTTPNFCADPAVVAIDVLLAAMRKIFDPTRTDDCAPLGAGNPDVKFFASSVTPLSWWDSFTASMGSADPCKDPLLWVRLVSRFRSEEFPQQSVMPGPCAGTRVAELEVGIARCVSMSVETDWAVVAQEMEISRDDSFQLENVLCLAAGELSATHHVALVATDTIVPYGPDGGIQSWSGILYVGF